jgi:hypothetical protein
MTRLLPGLALAVLLVCVGACGNADPTTGTKEEPADRVTLAKFHAVANDMTYDQVVAVVGSEGEQVTQPGKGKVATVIVTWKNRSGSSMTVTFQNARVVSKSQLGLR